MAILEKSITAECYRVVFSVELKDDNIRLDQFIMNHFSNFSRELIKRKIKNREVTIEGRSSPHRPSAKVHEGEKVTFVSYPGQFEAELWRGKEVDQVKKLDIIYEDQGLYVVNKPPFMAAHPTGRHLFYTVTTHLESIHKRTIHSIHRLDRETSGVILMGKNPQSAHQLTEEFIQNRVAKCYFFIAKSDHFEKKSNQFSTNLRMGPRGAGRERVYIETYPENSKMGKSATTHFHLLANYNPYYLGLAFPKTGRQHQIRVHAKAIGLPLLGDKLYLGDYPLFQRFKDQYASENDHDFMEIPRQALHATALRITYSQVKKLFFAPIPEDLAKWCTQKLNLQEDDINQLIQDKLEELNF